MINEIEKEVGGLSLVQKRICAGIFDLTMAAICSRMSGVLLYPFTVSFTSMSFYENPNMFLFNLVMTLNWILGFGFFFGYYVTQMTLFGKTVGKSVFRLTVINEQGNRLSRSHVIKREVFGRLLSLPFFGDLWIFLNKERKTATDYFAKTRVIEQS